jgi:hypothetical protein
MRFYQHPQKHCDNAQIIGLKIMIVYEIMIPKLETVQKDLKDGLFSDKIEL